ncbi:membrane protein, partial [Mycobacterium tuberculosis]
FAGYLLTYTIANNGKEFAELGPQQDTDELAIRKPGESRGTEPNMRPDRNTNARRTAPDTVEINLETKRLGLDQAPVDPQLTFAAQFRTPSTVTVDFGSQFCQGERLAGQRR